MSDPWSGLSAAARERLILALDFPSAAPAFAFLSALRGAHSPKWVKVGLELFLAEGALMIRALHEQGYSVFLDLKLHDIPNTVASAVRALGQLEVEMLTLHAAGGTAMLRAAAEAADSLMRPPRLLAVTVLTSMDAAQLESVGVSAAPQEQVRRLARVAREAGISGLVASPLEAAMLRSGAGGDELYLVTPGIRPKGAQGGDDQQRVATPAEALASGATQLVVGRPVTRAADPAAAYAAILGEIEDALSQSEPQPAAW